MKLLVGPPGAQRASGSTYSGRMGFERCAANSAALLRAHGWNGTSPLGGSLTRLGARPGRGPSGARRSSSGPPPWGSVKLLWLPMVLDQCPCTSGWPSARTGPVSRPDHGHGALAERRGTLRRERQRREGEGGGDNRAGHHGSLNSVG